MNSRRKRVAGRRARNEGLEADSTTPAVSEVPRRRGCSNADSAPADFRSPKKIQKQLEKSKFAEWRGGMVSRGEEGSQNGSRTSSPGLKEGEYVGYVRNGDGGNKTPRRTNG